MGEVCNMGCKVDAMAVGSVVCIVLTFEGTPGLIEGSLVSVGGNEIGLDGGERNADSLCSRTVAR